jgi:hypothetical protein
MNDELEKFGGIKTIKLMRMGTTMADVIRDALIARVEFQQAEIDKYKLLWQNSEKRLAGAHDWATGNEAELKKLRELRVMVQESFPSEILPHTHVAGRDNIDSCGICGRSFRDMVHLRADEGIAQRIEAIEVKARECKELEPK